MFMLFMLIVANKNKQNTFLDFAVLFESTVLFMSGRVAR